MGKEILRQLKNIPGEEDGFLSVKQGGSSFVIRRKYDSPGLRDLLENPESFVQNAVQIIKDSRTTKACITELPEGGKVFLKRYNVKGFLYILKYLFRDARSFRSFVNSIAFEAAGIPVPKVLAAACERKHGLIRNSFIVTECLEGTVTTLDFYRMLIEDKELKQHFIEESTSLLSSIHSAGLIHGDFKMSNIFIKKSAENVFSFGIWDLDGSVTGNAPLTEKIRVYELARLISSFVEIGLRMEYFQGLDRAVEMFMDSYGKSSGIQLDKEKLGLKAACFLEKTLRRKQ